MVPVEQARGGRRAWQGDTVCRVQQGVVCRALQERMPSAEGRRCVCVASADVCGVGWSSVMSWHEMQLYGGERCAVAGGMKGALCISVWL